MSISIEPRRGQHSALSWRKLEVSSPRRSDPPMPAAADDSADKMNKTLAMQPVLLAYGACISTVSPALTAYQLTRVYGKAVPPAQLARMSVAIFPHQTVLKCLQMNVATPVKEHLNPWFAFGVVGVLQARAS